MENKMAERLDGRKERQLRSVRLTPDYTKYAEGSVLIEMGGTRVLCTASVEEKVPPHVRGTGAGWVTAEYAMLPRATQERNQRDVARLKLAPRSSEIQRLIGRALRACLDLGALGERSIIVDCDVLQADGGTRTASITGGFVALAMACRRLVDQGVIKRMPITRYLAAVSVGIVDGRPLLDLCYGEDSRADVDMNVVMDDEGGLIEVQGTGEHNTFTQKELITMLGYAKEGIRKLIEKQKKLVSLTPVVRRGTFVIATHNQGKLQEMQEMLSGFGIQALSQGDVGCTLEPEEDGTTFEENALIKAAAVCRATGLPAIADDSGVVVDALDGQPGIYSARYAGEDATDEQRIEKLLKNLEGVPEEKRTAHFVSALALCMPDGRSLVLRGECHGVIMEQAMGTLGFGYDPVFYYPPERATFGQLDPAIKNQISHRANAMKLFAQKLPQFLAEE